MKRTVWRRQSKTLIGIVLLTTLGLLLGPFGRAAASDRRLRFEHFTVADGLSQNTVLAILQDRIGFLWFGTEYGLNKYDGYGLTVYQHGLDKPLTLADNTVTALFEDRAGNLWVGTRMGLDRFDRTREAFIHYADETGHSLGRVNALAEDDAGQLWIGTAESGLWLLDETSGALTHVRHDPTAAGSLSDDTIYDLLQDRHGGMWVATAGGLDFYDAAAQDFRHYRQDPSNPNSPTSNQVRVILEDRSGDLWLGTEGGGLNRFDPQTGLFSYYMASPIDSRSLVDNRVVALLEDNQGILWAATPQGISRLDREAGLFSTYSHDSKDPWSLGSSQVLALYQDRSGVVWIGTDGAGLSQYKPGAHKFDLYQANPLIPGGLSGNLVLSILTDRERNLWVGTGEAGLNRLDRATGEWRVYRSDPADPGSLSSDLVSALAEDRQGALWVGTSGGGLNRLDEQAETFTHFRSVLGEPTSLSSNNLLSLLVDRAGRLWAGTLDAGLNRFDSEQEVFIHYRHNPEDPTSLSDDSVTTIFQDQTGVLWIGTFSGGLNRLDPEPGHFTHYRYDPQNPTSLSSDQIYSLAEMPAGVLWVGTREGLNRLEVSTGMVTRYTAQEGLPANVICGLLPDEQGRLWISTINGLARFDPQNEEFRNYTVQDGLQGPEFNPGAYFKSRQGELFFGGVQGFNAFFPVEVQDTNLPPQVVITAFKVQNETVAKDLAGETPIRLSYRDSFVSFEFAALDFNAPEKNTFAYQLAGFDDEWIQAGSRNFVSYTNLPGGTYTFHVRAANSDGVWNKRGVTLPVIVTPPVWETTWFQALVVFGLLAAGYASYRWRVRSIEQRNLELETRVAELSQQVEAAAVAAERTRLARDLHDSVTQSLYSLTLLTEAGLRMLANGDLDESRANQERLGEIAQQALQEMRLMVFELRPPELEQTGLAGALERRLEAVERRAGINARLIVAGQPELSPHEASELYLLAQEALNNALKHAGSDTVIVRLQAEDGCVTLDVEDNGRGFDQQAAARSGGMGLLGMRERAESLGGSLSIHSAPGSGTRIRFSNFSTNENNVEEGQHG